MTDKQTGELYHWQNMAPQDVNQYLKCLRQLIGELRDLEDAKVNKLLDKYNVHNIDVDGFYRVNLDFPEERFERGSK